MIQNEVVFSITFYPGKPGCLSLTICWDEKIVFEKKIVFSNKIGRKGAGIHRSFRVPVIIGASGNNFGSSFLPTSRWNFRFLYLS